jgi:YVTN family beta-propeller protein
MRFMFSLKQLSLLALAGSLFLTACDPDKEEDPQVSLPAPSERVYVVNEGNFNSPTGEISLYNTSLLQVTSAELYNSVNRSALGDNLQSMTIIGTKAYLAVTASDSLNVVTLADFRHSAGLHLKQPRYLVAVSATKAYVTQWNGYTATGTVGIVDLTTNRLTGTISTGLGVQPEQILLGKNGLVYVTNMSSNFLTVINPATDAVQAPIATPSGPKNIVQDNAGNIWVLCNPYVGTTDHIIRFNPATPATQTDIAFPNDYRNGNLRINPAGDQVFVSLATGTYQLPLTATALPATPVIRRNFYGLGIDKDNVLYAATPRGTANGYVARYTSTGTKIDSFQVGKYPNGFVFN